MVQQLNQDQTTEPQMTPEQQELANTILKLMQYQGRIYANNRPIRQTLKNLAEYLAGEKYQGIEDPTELSTLVDQALSASPKVFLREEEDGEVVFKTTKKGVAPELETGNKINPHSFRNRLYEGARPVAEPTPDELASRSRAGESHPTNLPKAAEATSAPTATAPTPSVTPPANRTPVVQPATSQPAVAQPPKPATPPVVEPVPAIAEPAPVIQPVQQAPVAQPAPEPTPAPVEVAPVAEAAPVATASRIIELAPGVEADLSLPTNQIMSEFGNHFRTALVKGLQSNNNLVNFGNEWFLEDMTTHYSKGDLRRVREYILEMGGPVTSGDIMNDVFNKRPQEGDYSIGRFSLDYRLSREKKDFEFAGTNDDHIWTTTGVPTIGTTRYKATEIGTDYKFLEDAALVDPSEVRTENGKLVWEHTLTFYEYENGVLPYDTSAKTIFPKPLLEEQKSVILRLEAPQLDVIYNAELRYPSGNRGGWIVGLEGFFSDNLVPGAVLVISQGNKSNHFLIEYKQGEEQEARLLFWDERRQRFVFRPIIFACAINREDALTPDRYSRIEGQHRLDESERKRNETVLATAFEYAGQRQGDSYYALLDDLHPVANIDRPFSHAYLRSLLSSSGAMFRQDESIPDAFYYKPPTSRR